MLGAPDDSISRIPLFDRLDEAVEKPWVEPSPGTMLGQYALRRKLGYGRYADVWLAEDMELRVEVAIKVYTPHRFGEPERRQAAERILKGAHTMSQLSHANIVQIRSTANLSGGYLWFCMEYFPEGDLKKALDGGRLSVAECVQVVNDVIEAMTHTHQCEYRHRDIRPANILLRRDSAGKMRGVLADFDMAYWEAVVFAFPQDMTSLGSSSMTRYQPYDLLKAPRGAAKKTLNRRSSNDVYAICVLLLDIFVNEECGTSEGSASSFVTELRESGRKFRGGESPDDELIERVAHILERGLRSQEAQRYRSADELRAAWETIGHVVSLPAILAGVLVMASGLLMCEYFAYSQRGTDAYRLWASVAIAVAGLGSMGTVVALFGGLVPLKAIQSLRNGAIRRAFRGRTRRAIVVASLLVIVIVQFFACGPLQRKWTYRVAAASGCQMVDGDGAPLGAIDDDARSVRKFQGADRLRCPTGAKDHVTIVGLSVLAPDVRVVALDVDAGVDAALPVDASVDARPRERVTLEAPIGEDAIHRLLRDRVLDADFLRILDQERAAWPASKQQGLPRITYVLIGEELQIVVELMDEAIGISNTRRSVAKSNPLFTDYKWRAMAGHLAALSMRCEKAMAFLRQALRHHGVDNTGIWIADAIRCMSGKSEFNAVRTAVQSLPLDSGGKDRFISTLAWVALSSNVDLSRTGTRWRAVLLLDILGAEWDDQRSEVMLDLFRTSTECDDLYAAAEHAKKYVDASVQQTLQASLQARGICPSVIDRFSYPASVSSPSPDAMSP